MSTRTPRQFFKPLAIGAPEPMRDLPVRLERMIHFVPGHNEKVRSKTPDMAAKVDVILANLEDAIPSDAKDAARAGAIEMSKMIDWKASGTGLWTRVNPLNSPWFLDDVTEIVTKAGNIFDVIIDIGIRCNMVRSCNVFDHDMLDIAVQIARYGSFKSIV